MTARSQVQFAQGDLLFTRVPSAAGLPVAAEDGRLILARGEATGHHHSVPATAGTLVQRDDVMFLTLTELTAVTHQEHAPIMLTPGVWQVTRQREWTDADEPIWVAD